jgi:hypothetical protein
MFVVGLDLGQAADPSALGILDVQGEGPHRTFDCRYLEQFPLGTSYPAIVRTVGALLQRAPLHGQAQLVIDQTGVGRAIYDLFVEADLRPVGITITGGASWHRESAYQWHVSKNLLVSVVQKTLQAQTLRIAKSLPQAGVLQKELQDFRVKISKAANELYEAREGAHDDLVLAIAIALHLAHYPLRRWLPVGD